MVDKGLSVFKNIVLHEVLSVVSSPVVDEGYRKGYLDSFRRCAGFWFSKPELEYCAEKYNLFAVNNGEDE